MIEMERAKRYVLVRNGMYLSRNPMRTVNSAYDAAQYRTWKEALKLAKEYQAKVRIFNPITGEIAHA